MQHPTDQQKQQYLRFLAIFQLGKQRYTTVVGHTKGYYAGVKQQDYLTDEEREEAKFLLRQMFKKISSTSITSDF